MNELKRRMTMKAVLESFYADKSENTIKMYQSVFKTFFGNRNPVQAMKKMTKFGLYSVCKSMYQKSACSTLQKYLDYLSTFAEFLLFLDIIESNIPHQVKKRIPKDHTPKRPTKCFTQEEIDIAMASNASPLWKAVYALAFYTGMRVSEISNIQTQDITADFSFITLRMTKNKTDRVQPIPLAIREILKQYSQVRPNRPYFFVSHQGSQLRPISIYKHFTLKLGKPPHAARASVVTRLKIKGCNPKAIADFVGHRSITEQDTYDKRENQAVEASLVLVQ